MEQMVIGLLIVVLGASWLARKAFQWDAEWAEEQTRVAAASPEDKVMQRLAMIQWEEEQRRAKLDNYAKQGEWKGEFWKKRSETIAKEMGLQQRWEKAQEKRRAS